MKRAFGSRGRSNMGTVREVGRAVGGPSSSTTTTTTTRPINTNNNNNNSLSLTQPLLLSSTCYSNLSCCSGGGSSSLVSPFVWPNYNYSTTSNCLCDGELDWVYVNGGEEEEEVWAPKTRVFDGFCLGPVPSQDEVEEAISALKCAANSASFMQLSRGQSSYASNKDIANQYDNDEMDMVSTTASELDWIEPSLIFNYPRALESYGAERVYEAFHLLQTEPLVQKIVSSLSTDKAVWEAVLNNDVVRELRDSYAAEGDTPSGSGSGSGRGASSTGVF
ncbi:hypothetical protein Syun_018214 [Stephania yunnanensis]|uniref:Uncharacterized protein n=1 Tax=Stephania yunnanensis TaxID=152371 RepID=A0AAP0IRU2_9MAGN